MNKQELLKESKKIIDELISTHHFDTTSNIIYNGAYIHIHPTCFFGDEDDELIIKYEKIIGNKIFRTNTFCYNKQHGSQKKIGNHFYDQYNSTTYRLIKPYMNLTHRFSSYKTI
jgi:hypothetical protein